jgi:hypothetical protein
MMATLGGCGDGYELPCYRIKESKRSQDERKRHPGFPLDPHIAEPVIGRRTRADPLAYAGYFFCYRIKESGDLPDDTSPTLEGFSPFGPLGISGNQK